MSGRSFLCDLWFSQTLRHKNYIYIYIYIYILIGWQAYRGDQIYRKNSPNITLKSNPSKKKHLPGVYTYKTQSTADFGEIWVPENLVPRLLET